MNTNEGKRGQRVRLTAGRPEYGLTIGETGTLTEDNDGAPFVLFDGHEKTWAIDTTCLELIEPLPVAQPAAALKIEAGKFYRTRDGRKVGPIVTTDNNEYWPFKWPEQTMYYRVDGYSCPGARHLHRDQDDIIAEWHDTPSAPVSAQVDAIAEEYGPPPAEPDTTMHIKFTSDFSELDAAILVRKKKLKKLIKLARNAGIELREAA